MLLRRPAGEPGTGNSAAARLAEGMADHLVEAVGMADRQGAAEGLRVRHWGRVGRERVDDHLALLGAD